MLVWSWKTIWDDQPIRQPIPQSTSQSTHQSIHQLINRCISLLCIAFLIEWKSVFALIAGFTRTKIGNNTAAVKATTATITRYLPLIGGSRCLCDDDVECMIFVPSVVTTEFNWKQLKATNTRRGCSTSTHTRAHTEIYSTTTVLLYVLLKCT